MSLSKPSQKEGGSAKQRKPNYCAVMGCYVEVAGVSELYGVTCRHVTSLVDKSAGDALLYIENNCKRFIEFGKVLERQSLVETTDSNEKLINDISLKPPDIDIFKITSAMNTLCKPVYRNVSGTVVSCRLYRGNIENVYGKTVFQYSIDDAQKSDQATFRSILGEVATFENHQRFAKLINLSAEFVVRGKCGQFATEGDSGRLVAAEIENNTIEIIGIILGGDYTGKETESDKSVCICLLLEKGLEYLCKEYGKEFSLSVSECRSLDIKRNIEPGRMIFFYTPRYPKPSNMDLVDQLITLTQCLDLKITGTTSLETIAHFETDLYRKVRQRENLEWQSVSYPTSDQTCIHQIFLACENIYSRKLKQAEKCLKNAYVMIPTQSCCFRLRLLCRLCCYSAWLMLEIDETERAGKILENVTDETERAGKILENVTDETERAGKILENVTDETERAGKILENVIPFMEEKRSEVSFPVDCLGYLYYISSRYHKKLHGNENEETAKQMALKAIRVFEDEYRNNGSSKKNLALAYVNYAHLLLGFGEQFDQVNHKIEDTIVNEAEAMLIEADKIKGNDCSVEDVYFFNTWGEYHFQKEGYRKAQECFEMGMAMANSMELKKEKELCNKRLNAVRDYH